MPLKKVKMKIHSQAFLHSACVEVTCAVFVIVRRKTTLQSILILLSYKKFVREKEITFRYQKKDRYWIIKSLLHCRRSAHLYTVVHINNNHQDTLQLTLIRLTPKACLRRVSSKPPGAYLITIYFIKSIIFFFSLFFFLFFLGGGGAT